MRGRCQPEQESISIPIPISISISISINSICSICSISPPPIQKMIGLIDNHCLEATSEGRLPCRTTSVYTTKRNAPSFESGEVLLQGNRVVVSFILRSEQQRDIPLGETFTQSLDP